MQHKKTAITLAYMTIVVVFGIGLYSGFARGLQEMPMLDGNLPLDFIIALVITGLGCLALAMGAYEGPVLAIGAVGVFVVLSVSQGLVLNRYLTLSAILFAIGVYGMVRSRNAVRVLMSIELMLNAVNINLVAFARYIDPVDVKGQLFTIFILTVAAAEAAVGLAIVLQIYRNTSTIDMNRFNILKW